MSRRSPDVSVLIRTRDKERHFYRLLQRLSHQTVRPSEVVVVDNFSSESKLNEMIGLVMVAKKRFFSNRIGMKIVPITDQEFSYAYSANVGILVAECDLVCITNGHCLPLSDEWLESGVAHFQSRSVVGVGGYALPDEYGSTWEKIVYDWRWRRLNEASRFYVKDDYFSTVNCILRKPLWKEYPFDEKMLEEIPDASRFGGEDYDWGLEMLARGYRLVVEPKFDVYHSHGETFSQLLPKYVVWRRIRKAVRSLARPRNSYTRLKDVEPLHYSL